MKKIDFDVAKTICEEYNKDQCIILTWDETSGETWVTTFGVDDKNSIQACNGGKLIKDFLQLKREHDAIPTRFEEWVINHVDRYYYASGRNYDTYVETTMWHEIHTLQRKETVRTETISVGDKWKLPDWAKAITTRRKSLESI